MSFGVEGRWYVQRLSMITSVPDIVYTFLIFRHVKKIINVENDYELIGRVSTEDN